MFSPSLPNTKTGVFLFVGRGGKYALVKRYSAGAKLREPQPKYNNNARYMRISLLDARE